MLRRIWFQYHNTQKLGHEPYGDYVYTRKKIDAEEGDLVLLIEGNKSPRQYQLWSWAEVDRIQKKKTSFSVYTKNERTVRVSLTGPDFEKFRSDHANLASGFTDITNHPFTPQLLELSGIKKGQEDHHPIPNGTPPSWADSWGQDQYGLFAEFAIPSSSGEVRQRLRWIPPGEFMMGSGEKEMGRYAHESHPKNVRIVNGFWMLDKPVTQATWAAVMFYNPSYFQSEQRPVESISWRDTEDFFRSLDQGLELRLPTETEWEYACRAGTTEATYTGDLKILGDRNAPVLDPIAWYAGNSGHEFDLEKGEDSSGWFEKQIDHQIAGTRMVGIKKPNPWGLFDMLGNVWEWCSDDWHDDMPSIEPESDPEPLKIIRGGSWNFNARYIRAASKDRTRANNVDKSIGFRFVVPG